MTFVIVQQLTFEWISAKRLHGEYFNLVCFSRLIERDTVVIDEPVTILIRDDVPSVAHFAIGIVFSAIIEKKKLKFV